MYKEKQINSSNSYLAGLAWRVHRRKYDPPSPDECASGSGRDKARQGKARKGSQGEWEAGRQGERKVPLGLGK